MVCRRMYPGPVMKWTTVLESSLPILASHSGDSKPLRTKMLYPVSVLMDLVVSHSSSHPFSIQIFVSSTVLFEKRVTSGFCEATLPGVEHPPRIRSEVMMNIIFMLFISDLTGNFFKAGRPFRLSVKNTVKKLFTEEEVISFRIQQRNIN
jgi:hypothetical protein